MSCSGPAALAADAPVNTKDAPAQVNFAATRHFVYLAEGSAGYKAVMQSKDSDVIVTAVEGNEVVFRIKNREVGASIQPSEGACPFDFDYNAARGTISHGHVGHALHSLK